MMVLSGFKAVLTCRSDKHAAPTFRADMTIAGFYRVAGQFDVCLLAIADI